MTAQTILPANSVRGGDLVTNSCRFNAPDDAYMHKTPSSDGSRRIGTFSIWVKLALNSSEGQYLFSGSPDASTTTSLGLSIDGDDLRFNGWTGNSQHMLLVTDRKFRDPSAWYHIVVAWDTTQGTASNRVKIYVNGVQETSFSTETYPNENRDLNINNASNKTLIGARSTANYAFGDGHYSEVVMIDGTALSPTSFGEFDSDTPTVWKPIDVSGLTFGTNGFYLDFEDSSNLGNDKSGGTDLTEVNIAATDQSTDTCTNNFSTMNPLDFQASTQTLAEGNLKITADSGGDWDTVASTIGVTTGKWYFEAKLITLGTNAIVGVIDINDARLNTTTAYYIGQSTPGKGYQNNGARPDNGASFGDTYTANDIIGVAIDMDNLKVYFSKNGTFQDSGDPTSGATGTGAQDLTSGTTYCFAVSGYASSVWEANFGSPPYSESGGNSDADGHGNFLTAPPSGYFALNTKNLAEYGG